MFKDTKSISISRQRESVAGETSFLPISAGKASVLIFCQEIMLRYRVNRSPYKSNLQLSCEFAESGSSPEVPVRVKSESACLESSPEVSDSSLNPTRSELEPESKDSSPHL